MPSLYSLRLCQQHHFHLLTLHGDAFSCLARTPAGNRKNLNLLVFSGVTLQGSSRCWIFWPKSVFKLVYERRAEQQMETLHGDEKAYRMKIPWIANCHKEELFPRKRGYQSCHSTCVNQQVQIRLSPHGIGSIRPSNLNNLVYKSFSSLHKDSIFSLSHSPPLFVGTVYSQVCLWTLSN